jgi:aerobic C4-dicarboxylate transport protein
VGIDRFMSEARALTNFAGNAVATVLIGHWTGELDHRRLALVLGGGLPFDESTQLARPAGEPEPSAEREPDAMIPSPR